MLKGRIRQTSDRELLPKKDNISAMTIKINWKFLEGFGNDGGGEN